MSINYAVLGILSVKPLTGYDLKKIIEDSPFMHWSGNNNQIYRALSELLKDGLVSNEVLFEENSPTKKLYTITDKGMSELKNWSMKDPETPELKNSFLVQLAFTNELNNDEVISLISKYEEEIKIKILMEENKRNFYFSPNRNAREKLIWNFIYENVIEYYKNELLLIQKLKENINNL